jgi:hypothetical protein
MTKLMMAVVICMSGALYDPTRILYHLGPDAAALGWTLKRTFGVR